MDVNQEAIKWLDEHPKPRAAVAHHGRPPILKLVEDGETSHDSDLQLRVVPIDEVWKFRRVGWKELY